MSDSERWAAWFDGKEFSSDWTSGHYANWERLFAPIVGDVRTVLEVGSWEGRSAIFFLEFFKQAKITCIDSFVGGAEQHYPDHAREIPLIEARFDRNLAPFGARVEKIKATSVAGLDGLKGRTFDFIYIDGDHRRDQAWIDTLLAWPLVKDGGTIMWDDAVYRVGNPPEPGPAEAIVPFVASHANELRVLHRGRQLVARRESGHGGVRSALWKVACRMIDPRGR